MDPEGDVAGEGHDRDEADQQDGEDGGREAQDDAGGGRDTLAALEAEPDGEAVAEDGAGTRRHGTGGPEPVEGGEGRDRTLEEVEQQGGEGQALAAGAQDVGSADVAEPMVRMSPSPAQRVRTKPNGTEPIR